MKPITDIQISKISVRYMETVESRYSILVIVSLWYGHQHHRISYIPAFLRAVYLVRVAMLVRTSRALRVWVRLREAQNEIDDDCN